MTTTRWMIPWNYQIFLLAVVLGPHPGDWIAEMLTE